MSSKFNPSSPHQAPPPQCHKSPEPTPIPIPPGFPEQLSAWVHWRDWDPLAPGEQASSFSLRQQGPAGNYHGCSASSGDRTCLTVSFTPGTGSATVLLEYWDPYRNPDSFNMGPAQVDPDKPFDTGLLQDIVIPAIDFRYVRIRE